MSARVLDRDLSVSIIVPVGAATNAFRQALAAIHAATPAADEVLVAVDGPAPQAADLARQIAARVIQLPVSRGPAVARNAAARAATKDVLLFVDADVAISPGLVAQVKHAMADSSVDAVVGCYDENPPETNFCSQYKNLLQRFVHVHASREGSTFWGACGAVRREAFFAAGGFDERFLVPCVEDIDLGYRLKQRGCRIEFRPELEIKHLKRWTAASLLKSDIFRRAVPWTWLLMRESSMAPDLNLDYRSRIAAALALVLAASLVASWLWPIALVAGVAAAAALVVIDWQLATFFAKRRGVWFAARALAWHWMYYLYSTAAFVVAAALYPVAGRRQVELSRAQLPLRDERRGEVHAR